MFTLPIATLKQTPDELPLSVHVLEIGVFTARYVTCGKTMMHTTLGIHTAWAWISNYYK